MRKFGSKLAIIVIGTFLCLGGCVLIITTLHPCGWLDLSLNYNGCVTKLNVSSGYNGVFAKDIEMYAGVTNKVNVWRMADGSLLHSVPGQVGVFSPDGMYFVAGSLAEISIWSTQDWKLQKVLNTNTEIVTHISVAPDASTLVVSDRNGSIQLWETNDWTLKHNLEGHQDHVSSLAYSPDGSLIASSSYDHTIRLWNVENGTLQRVLRGHSSVVEKIAFAPDNKTLASASWDGTVRVWQINNGVSIYTLKDINGNIYDVTYSSNGDILAAAGVFGIVKFWDMNNNGALIGGFRQNWIGYGIEALAFAPKDNLVAVAQRKGAIELYDIQKLLRSSN